MRRASPSVAVGQRIAVAQSPPPVSGCLARRQPSPSPRPAAPSAPPTHGQLGQLAAALITASGCIDEVRQEANIGPIISNEIAQQALLLIVLGSIGILAWMTFRFADFRMGMTAIAALIHDVHRGRRASSPSWARFIGLQVDALFVTAMLTVIGFSVHDTIVVYDRIRENRIRHAGEPFPAIVNHSLLQTLGRSLNTSMTTVHGALRAAALRQRRHPRLRLRDDDRHHLGDLLVDLQRQRTARDVARVGRRAPPAANSPPRAAAERAVTYLARLERDA